MGSKRTVEPRGQLGGPAAAVPEGNEDGPARGPTAAAGSRARAQGRGAQAGTPPQPPTCAAGRLEARPAGASRPAAACAAAFPQTRAGRARQVSGGGDGGGGGGGPGPGGPRGSAGQPGRAQGPSSGGGRGRGLRGPEPGSRPSPRRPAWGGKPPGREPGRRGRLRWLPEPGPGASAAAGTGRDAAAGRAREPGISALPRSLPCMLLTAGWPGAGDPTGPGVPLPLPPPEPPPPLGLGAAIVGSEEPSGAAAAAMQQARPLARPRGAASARLGPAHRHAPGTPPARPRPSLTRSPTRCSAAEPPAGAGAGDPKSCPQTACLLARPKAVCRIRSALCV